MEKKTKVTKKKSTKKKTKDSKKTAGTKKTKPVKKAKDPKKTVETAKAKPAKDSKKYIENVGKELREAIQGVLDKHSEVIVFNVEHGKPVIVFKEHYSMEEETNAVHIAVGRDTKGNFRGEIDFSYIAKSGEIIE